FDVKKLYYWQANGADAAFNQDGTNSFTIKCNSCGSKYDDLQISFDGVDVKIGKTYVLQFRAKCTSSFVLPKICLMSKSGSWDDYTKSHVDCALKVSNEFNTYTVPYKAATNDPEGKITFYIGGALPSGATLSVDSISLVERDGVTAVGDIGNIIMNKGETVGKKKLSKDDLVEQNDFWYDTENNRLDVFSKENPASLFKSIECAVTRDIINQSNRSYVIYDGLDLRYGGAHGIAGDNTHNIIIRNCDLSFIGGGLLDGERYGNGIEFWNDAHDNLVEGCRIWDAYDAALSNQGNGQDVKQYRLEYKNNTIWNCEYSFEVWNKNESSVMKDIFFEMNVCRDAGYGWGHSQRPDKGGYHLCFYRNSANVSNLKIRSNAFIHGIGSIIFKSGDWNCFDRVAIEGNIISQEDVLPIAILDGITYNQDRFKELQHAVEKGLGRIY
ncbi:MAG TPA: carbohydrate binding domain-containing protein, partial [Clostridia bacterium]